MGDPAGRLHPLVAAAGGQIAALDYQIDYFIALYGDEVGEVELQRLERLREERRKFRGIKDRLEEKLFMSRSG